MWYVVNSNNKIWHSLTNFKLDLYAYDGDGPVPRLTSNPVVQKVGHFPIRMPKLEGVQPGDKVTLTIRMYFGLTEIKIESVIQDQVFTFTSAFDSSDSSHTVKTSQQQQQIGGYGSPAAPQYPPSHHSHQTYPVNVIPQPSLLNKRNSSGYSTQDYYSQPNYTPQQQQHARPLYSAQEYYGNAGMDNYGGYPPACNNNNYTR